MLAFECIPSLNAQFRKHEDGCMSDCPRMCKWWFVSNSMKGFPLEDLYNALGNTKGYVFNIFLDILSYWDTIRV